MVPCRGLSYYACGGVEGGEAGNGKCSLSHKMTAEILRLCVCVYVCVLPLMEFGIVKLKLTPY